MEGGREGGRDGWMDGWIDKTDLLLLNTFIIILFRSRVSAVVLT